MLIGSIKRSWLKILWPADTILTFPSLFTVRSLISLISFGKLQNVIANSEHSEDCTTTLTDVTELGKHRQCVRTGNHRLTEGGGEDRLNIWTHCATVDGSNRRLSGCRLVGRGDDCTQIYGVSELYFLHDSQIWQSTWGSLDGACMKRKYEGYESAQLECSNFRIFHAIVKKKNNRWPMDLTDGHGSANVNKHCSAACTSPLRFWSRQMRQTNSINKPIMGPSTQQFFFSSSDVIASTCFDHTIIIRRQIVVYCRKWFAWLQ
jgi:hypothetical protein